jgi:small-conductance mechanosensitive channel
MVEIDETWLGSVVGFMLERAAEIVLLLIVWFGFPLLERAARRFARRHLPALTDGRDYEYLVTIVLRYAKYFVVVLILLTIFGLNQVVSTALASVGLTALILGLAAQTVASNMVAGFFVLLDNNVRIGDRIKIGEVEGSIQEIQLRTTQVLMDSGTLAIIPNKKMADEIVLNRTQRAPYRQADTHDAPASHPQLG